MAIKEIIVIYALKEIIVIYALILLLFTSGLSQPLQRRLDNSTDQEALLYFKSHITNDPYKVLDSWITNTSFCSWEGVTCNITKQRVTGLNLRNLSFVGTIAPQLANLSFLGLLNLEDNSFHGTIPQELGQLFRLESLSLGSNELEGSIPPSLALCQRLKMLDLSQNRLEGRIPSELGGLSQLQILTFSNNNFLTGPIPSSFNNLSSLTNLILDRNSLYGPLPEHLGRLRGLINLQIALNYNITGEVPPSLFNSSSLIVVSMGGNALGGQLPPDMFSKMTSLSTLFLGSNKFTGSIPVSLANASQLERLDLGRNRFSGRIPLLGNLASIQVLSFDTNQLTSGGEGGLDFLSSLSNSTRLQVFSIAANRFTGKLPPSIGGLSRQLLKFVIGGNQFDGPLPEEIGNLAGLSMLSIEYNSFSGNIPSTIGKLQNLQSLYLHGNRFTGNIPESLGNLTNLFELTLNNNNLTGTIPTSLSNCQRLQVLDVSVNGISGSIPTEILTIPNLSKVLNLSWNSFSGSLPIEMGKLTKIQGIDLSMNKLSGNIPSTIGDCSNLLILDMSKNLFRGSIPDSIGNLKGIEFIDLSSNNLSGNIPSSLESLKFLQYLNLSMNKLQGEVPKEGVFTNSTAIFLTGNPDLCGGVTKLKLPNCTEPKKETDRSKNKLVIGLAVGFGTGSLILILCFLGFLWKISRPASYPRTELIPFKEPHRLYTYLDLKAATNNFSSNNWLGEGSFGSVYKGSLNDGTVAAVKVFNMEQRGAYKSFIAECEALRFVRHRNLVKIISACDSGDFNALIMEFYPNGSLENWLHGSNDSGGQERRRSLNLAGRIDAAIDVASGIEYLHHDCETEIVHCDLKPSNVLFDEDMTAHIGDFGLARMLQNAMDDKLSSTVGLKGSIGYIAPEYGIQGGISTKGDVYSYGILLLEMFTGRRPTDEIFTGDMNLQKWVSEAIPTRVMKVVDAELREFHDKQAQDCLLQVMHIGLLCAVQSPEDRPNMREVTVMMRSARDKLKEGQGDRQ